MDWSWVRRLSFLPETAAPMETILLKGYGLYRMVAENHAKYAVPGMIENGDIRIAVREGVGSG